MRILVTRPQPAAEKTAARLRVLGHEPLVLPLTKGISEPDAVREALLQERFTALALTSAQAVHTLALLAGDLAPYLDIPVFCVGAATANAAGLLGFRKIITGPGTGEGLAERIAVELAADPKLRILYLAGDPRSPEFEAGLHRLAVDFRVTQIYRMVPLDNAEHRLQSILTKTPPDAVLLYSSETAHRFLNLPSADDLTDLRYLCLSSAIASILPATIRNVAVAATSDEDSLLRLL
ncbi:uroporphyrinogen-III synthase [Rhizobium sp. 32-5/1]|uniref:uroporphyrinogen-III synthase n=1 Tax=Rhizobium sp. 32-5/1 TaxID=3019602 RepID=UPI00240D9886|nr:uroporphyrinogen-III synthase [Rhizobium sp. 32-5/1]WEZ82218.1 uroporphyrinogen-III synthase [Rhizobium sp. 32-5/1]